MISNQTKFRPVFSKLESKIINLPLNEGWVYVAEDTGKIFIDADGKRKQIGGSGGGGGGGSSSIVWSFGDEEEGNLVKATSDASDGDPVFYMSLSAVEGGALPELDALVINSDGRFFKVTDNTLNEDRMFTLNLIAVSGGGEGGGGGGTSAKDLSLSEENISNSSVYIYGQDTNITFIPVSDADPIVSLVVMAKDLMGNNPDVIRTYSVDSGTPCIFNANLLPLSNKIQVTALVTSQNAQYNKGRGLSRTYGDTITGIFPKCVDMHLAKPNDYIVGIQRGMASLPYIPFFTGLEGVKICYQVDGETEVEGAVLESGRDKNKQYLNIPAQSHGMHSVKLWLRVEINGQTFNSDQVVYEIPWIEDGNDTPVIWIKQELGTVVQYEPAVVEYMVYSSVAEEQGSTVEMQLMKDNIIVNTESVSYNPNKWLSMDLTPYYQPGNNTFVISTGAVSKRINFYITTEGARDLSLRYTETGNNQLEINFDSLGRSNSEIKANRSVWKSTAPTPRIAPANLAAIFDNFNWNSNGWMNDNDGKGSYLSVCNGASVRIPMSTIIMNTTSQAWTFEIRFRIRNAKKFATLVTEIPKYKYKVNGVICPDGQEKTIDEITAIGGEVALDEDGNPIMNEANTTKKIVQTEKYIAFKYLNSNNEGFVIGTQEAYFNTQGSTVNVKYKEDEIVNITFVVDRASDELSIYLNGILTGVANLSAVPQITMENIPFLINSEYCDFDLYKFRAYPIALTMPDVIHNYISDIRDISLYDENQLTDINDDTKLSYQKVLDYNEAHPEDPTMPYAVIDMTNCPKGTELPHYKGYACPVTIKFVNPVADYLLETGKITPYQYYTHCPSFTADNVNLDVQGTSSQKYPRRNFKTKFKDAGDTWVYTKGELEGVSIAKGGTLESGEKISKKWHMDHETIGVNKFTWKIDYMESSGSYNTGFANLMGSGVYSKHPLEDLNLDNVDASQYRTSVYGFPMMVFHKVGNTYTYIGRYNINLDKGANERYGFEESVEQPYVDKYWEEIDKTTNEVTATHNHPYIADVSECWELRDNQGTWCSWRFPNDTMRERGFKALMEGSTDGDPKYEVVQHFEARYHKNADQFEYAQNILLGKTNEKDYSADIGGDSNAAASAYCYDKLKNLEVLFKWLDSTDTRGANANRVFDEPITLEVSEEIKDAETMAAMGVTYEVRTIDGTQKTFGTFTCDSTEYRRQKFYAEFDKHLDKHYCAVYFVMTELMLCYDSRGKNMMIATFGPRERDGDYIWYPIFYDIDTQLGLNNVGAKLWDYDQDCSEKGTFSTKDSVLWVNFYDVFKNQVLSTYRQLRNGALAGHGEPIEAAYLARPLNYNGIDSVDVTKVSSYAMMGKRPIIAIGLDEYYKYVLPTKEAWKTQDGQYATANYLYACQGDRILSRSLLVTNRLLYMDSKWLGGDFTITTGAMGGLVIRSTANKVDVTSDKYTESDTLKPGQEYHEYPVPYFDATPIYNVTPYLNFYITTYTDENVFQNDEAYSEDKYPNGMPTKASPSVEESFRKYEVDQQLNYFAGTSYISSFGDMSTKYINQITLSKTPRLVDITIGSDIPGYFNNNQLDPFDLQTEVDIQGNVKAGHEKYLLEKIVLTNVNLTTSAGQPRNMDVRSASKLREFRALGNTNLAYVLFADGAPLDTVHLPDTVTRIIFKENKNLKKILRETPVIVTEMIDGEPVYADRSTYEGLFIDGVTNYTNSMAGGGSFISEISFDGDALGYGSYEILNNVVQRKNGTGRANRLKIRMADVHWSPYIQVEYGEEKLNDKTYYYLTDHSTYELYNRANDMWIDDTLNGRVFTYDDSYDESVIQDLSLLNIFLQDKAATPYGSINQFTNNVESMSGQQTYPTISGEMYVSNASGVAIDESLLTTTYAEAWPNLKITLANVNPAYIAKFVQKLDSGKEQEIDVRRYSRDGELVTPTMTDKRPSRQNYNFRGWTLDPSKTNIEDSQVQSLIDQGVIFTPEMYPTDNPIATLQFNAENDVYTFYAVFSITSFTIHFKDAVGGYDYTFYKAPYGTSLYSPEGYFTTDESELSETERYKFLGWTRDAENWLAKSARQAKTVDLTTITSQNADQTFYAVYIKEDCLTNPTDDKYFNFVAVKEGAIDESGHYTTYAFKDDYDETYSVKEGWAISPKVNMSGKITLPATHVDPVTGRELPVVKIAPAAFRGISDREPTEEERAKYPELEYADSINTPGLGYNITHIYWYGDTSQFRAIEAEAFQFAGNYNMFATDELNLANANRQYGVNIFKYFELPKNVRLIGNSAFSMCYALQPFDFSETKIARIEDSAFYSAFRCNEQTYDMLHFPGCLTYIGSSAFEILFYEDRVINAINILQFGGENDNCNLSYIGDGAFNMKTELHVINCFMYLREGADESIFESLQWFHNLSGGSGIPVNYSRQYP